MVRLAVPSSATRVPPSQKVAGHGSGEIGTLTDDLDNLLLSSKIAMLQVDRQKCIRRFTPAATALFSLLPSDIGRPLRDLSQKFTDVTFFPDIRMVLDGGDASRTEVQSEEGHWYVRQTLPYLLRDGVVEGAVITFSDVAADALQEARFYAEAIVNSVREPLLVVDGELRVHSVNQPFSELFHVSREEVIGRALHELDAGVWDRTDLPLLLRGVLETGSSLDGFEVTYQSVSLGSLTLVLNARTLHRGRGKSDLILVSLDDVTERRRTAQLLHENETAHREAEQVRERQLELTNALRVSTVGELATGLAHELNQPLSSISNVVEACRRHVLAGTIDAPKLLELLADLAGEAMRAAGIVAHLRSFVEKAEPQHEPVDLGEIIARVPHLLLRDMERSQICLRVEFTSDELRVHADRIQIEQVVVNLIQNAMDSIEQSGSSRREIELSTRRVGSAAEVSVRDTGTGITEDAAEGMFEPFFTTKAKGLGMGLALSRSFLESHRGRIWVESPTDGSGVIVRFSIPLSQPEAPLQAPM
ncbi:MAG TPA: PAS domain-containing protein [Candidatus Binatia bacterium]